MAHEVHLDTGLAGRVRATALWMEGAQIRETGTAFAALQEIARGVRDRQAGRTLAQVPGVGDARRLYRDFGLDPTRTRPSSEALLRRALKELPLHRVNEVVDWGNAVSLRHLLPLGLYDRQRLVGDTVVIRVGAEGEEYAGIRKGPVHLSGRLCVADDEGPFGSPTSDSLRTCITSDTTELFAIVFAPAQVEEERLEAATDMLADGFTRYAGARLRDRVRLDP